MGSQNPQPDPDPAETRDESSESDLTEDAPEGEFGGLPLSRRGALASLAGIGGLGLLSDPAQASHGGQHWQKDVDAGGNDLFDLGALAMQDNGTRIRDFAGANLAIENDVLNTDTWDTTVDAGGNDLTNLGSVNASTVNTDTLSDNGSGTINLGALVDADKNELKQLGAVAMQANKTKIVDFAGENLSIDGSNVLNARDTRTNVSEAGTEKVRNVEDINFGPNIAVNDDGDGSVTIDASDVSRWSDADGDDLLEASGFDGIDVGTVAAEFVETRKFGTTDATAIVFIVDDLSFMRVFPTPPGEASNILAGHTNNGAASGVVGATISGGGTSNRPNEVFDDYGTVAGGHANRAGSDDVDSSSAEAATVSGGEDNLASGDHATVAGGLENVASGDAATIGGGSGHQDVTGTAATVSGGSDNEATDDRVTVGGGSKNRAIAPDTTIAGGVDNDALADRATVGGGFKNKATLTASTVGGGTNNQATDHAATVPGGEGNRAEGEYSVAAGRNATAKAGSFVWGDGTEDRANGFRNTFTVQASGGVELYTTSDQSTGAILTSGDSNWFSVSSRTAKSNVEPVDPRSVLDGVVGLEISTWEYDTNPGVDHMGPMAEDFHEAFGLGHDEEFIGNVDADGVAFAAIQGLSQKLDEKDDRIDELEAENEQLRERLGAVEDRLTSLEAGQSSPATADD